jgi:hypothetical protein
MPEALAEASSFRNIAMIESGGSGSHESNSLNSGVRMFNIRI